MKLSVMGAWVRRMGVVSGLVWLGVVVEFSVEAAAIKAVATVTMVTDLVKEVGGARVEVSGLMGPGVDPHLYKATAGDVAKLTRADVIFYSGLLLEGKMQDLFGKMARSKRHVYAVTEAIPVESLLEPPEFAGHYDPHVWFDVVLWSRCAETVVTGLSAVDPEGRAYYEERARVWRERMRLLDQWVRERVMEVPVARRILITSHDAFNYFGRAYGFKVVALQGISTVEEASPADLVKLVDFIKANRVPAVFVESSVPPGTLRRISADAGVKIGGELFSDAMGTPGEMERGVDLGTYEGMIRHNVSTVTQALQSREASP